MRYTDDHAAKTRDRVVKEAARQLRRHGPDGVSVSKVMAGAGLTHGGFYAHFSSKDDLVVAAIGRMFESSRGRFETVTGGRTGPAALADFIDSYVSMAHCAAPESGCAVPALAGEVARLSGPARERFDMGVRSLVSRIEANLPEDKPERPVLARSVLSEMIGAVATARALSDATLAEDMLAASRNAIKRRAGLQKDA